MPNNDYGSVGGNELNWNPFNGLQYATLDTTYTQRGIGDYYYEFGAGDRDVIVYA
jgi:hypothetical protein